MDKGAVTHLKVLQLVKTSVGAAWALRQMRELVDLGVEVHVAMPDGPLAPQYEAAGVVVHPMQCNLPVRKPWEWPQLFKNMRDLVANTAPDIIHSHFVGTTLTMRLALRNSDSIPRVFQVPGPLHLEHPFFRRAELSTAGPSDYWIGSCKWTCDRYRKSGVSQDRLFLSYYGVDLDKFTRREKGKLRKELGVDDDTRLVGMVAFMYAPKRYLGQMRGLKGHEDLIDAMAICFQSEPNMKCVFIGGAWNNATWYEEKVRAYAAKRLGTRAVFLGTRHDVPELYPDLDLVAHPSHSENVGGAAESLLLKVPTLASNVGGFPDLVSHKETGWLVPPRDPSRLAAAILEAVRNPDQAQEMAKRGQEWARRLFNVKQNAQEMLKIYRDILSKRDIRQNDNISYVL